MDTYNLEWLVEKNGFLSPIQVRGQWLAQASQPRAAQWQFVSQKPGAVHRDLRPHKNVLIYG